MGRRRIALGTLAAGALAAAAIVRRLGRGAGDGRVDLYYDDGSLVTLAGHEAEPLIDVARAVLRAVRQ